MAESDAIPNAARNIPPPLCVILKTKNLQNAKDFDHPYYEYYPNNFSVFTRIENLQR
jgi:hypothetical protein